MEKIRQKPFFFIVILTAIILIVLGVFFLLKKTRNSSQDEANEPTPTVYFAQADSRIIVDLTPLDKGKTVLLTISNIPSDVTSIEYELTYQSDKKKEGVFGTIKLESGETTVERELTLGTCSSGKCVYHNIVDDKGILTVKFYAKSGPSRLQKEVTLL